MAEADTRSSAADRRPLSPHLQIYSPQINMMMSIVHRITGAALYFGTIILAVWLFSATAGRSAYDAVGALLAHPVGLVVMLGYTWALIHHALGGIRHLIWDTGRAMSIPAVNTLCWLTLIGSILITGGIWAWVLKLKGFY